MNEPVQIPRILFVCVKNAGRSQMAAALLERAAGASVRVRSAGSDPAEALHPVVVEAMAEAGIDLSSTPTRLTSRAVQAADVVITMGCGDACPVYSGTHYEDWEVDDPAGQALPEVREIRDAIGRRVSQLLESLGQPD